MDWSIQLEDLEETSVIKSYSNVVIYEGLWRKHQRVCVKKISKQKSNKSLIDRELYILSSCAHPRVCQYLGAAYEKDTTVHIVFEFMESGNLEEYVTSHSLTSRQEILILLDIAVGLEYLCLRKPHRIIHNDLKPSNVLLDVNGRAKLADFGVSSIFSKYNENYVMGTLRWIAPEIINKKQLHPLCDIYSFGLIAYFVWSKGKVPYQTHNGAQITYLKSNNQRSFLLSETSCEKKMSLVKRCTENKPENRPQSPREIIETLTKLLEEDCKSE